METVSGTDEAEGYQWKLNRKYIALKAPGMERYIRLRSLGKHYSEESIRQWILQPKSRIPAGKEGDSRFPKKKLKGIQALYYSYLYQMGALKQKPKRISPVLRADIRKLDARIEQMEFLQKHQITTVKSYSPTAHRWKRGYRHSRKSGSGCTGGILIPHGSMN